MHIMDLATIYSELYRIFLGNESFLFFLEIIFRTTIMYVYMLCAIRYVGKRGMGQLSPFEFLIVILLGSAGGDSMFYPDVPLLHAILTITVVVLLQKLLNYIVNPKNRFPINRLTNTFADPYIFYPEVI